MNSVSLVVWEGSEIDAFSNTHEGGCIAVVGQLRKDHGRLPLSYVEAVQRAGARARVISTFQLLADEDVPVGLDAVTGIDEDDTSALDDVSGLLLPGGGDIDPEYYGCARHPQTARISHRRDRFELNLIAAALERDMPILGICHGMQLLNVHFGGTLDQHLADDPSHQNHDAGMPSPKPVHGTKVETGSWLAEVFGATTFGVNSHHHQGVARLGEGLDPLVWADDGVLEAFVARGYSWVVSVQWHPEAMPDDPVQQRLFASFVDAAVTYDRRPGDQVAS